MLNFAEQTGSGAVIVVWYYLISSEIMKYIYPLIMPRDPPKTEKHFYLKN
tara:strand:- start:79 stop:228 length:150 start_codon:yes stop_codon:yes gene_type:complete